MLSQYTDSGKASRCLKNFIFFWSHFMTLASRYGPGL